MKNIISIITVLLLSLSFSFAQQREVQVRVDGLSCPFCAYGLEKKLLKLDGVMNLTIDVDNGILTFYEEKGKVVLEEEIRRVVKDAGFTPGEITYKKMLVKKSRSEPPKKE